MPGPAPITMQRGLTWLLLGSLLVLIFLGSSTARADRADEATAELKEVTTELNALDGWLDEAGRKQARWQKDLNEQDQAVSAIRQQVRGTEEALAETQNKIEELEAQKNELSVARVQQARRISEHVNAAYRLQGQDVVKALLNQEAPHDFERMLRYHRYFSDARMEVLDGYQLTLVAIQKNQERLTRERQTLQSAQRELEERQVALTEQRQERASLIDALNREVTSKSARAAQLRADRRRLERLLAELKRREQARDGSDFVARKGKLTQPSSGQLMYRYGESRADGRLRWQGMVYRTETAAPVRVVHPGRVVFADWLRGFGLLTIVDHGSGYMTLYGYTDDLTKTVGDFVEGGEVIAHAGQSGGQAFDGVYFEIRRRESILDPRAWLRR